nr:hypothetical protein CFP56_54843 [Quercus suber]
MWTWSSWDQDGVGSSVGHGAVPGGWSAERGPRDATSVALRPSTSSTVTERKMCLRVADVSPDTAQADWSGTASAELIDTCHRVTRPGIPADVQSSETGHGH